MLEYPQLDTSHSEIWYSFTMGEMPDGNPITQRDLIEFMMEVRLGMAAFTKTLGDFKLSLEEHTDRIDANTDDVRTDVTKRMDAIEKDVEALKVWKLTQAAWIAGALAVVGIIWIVVGKVSDKIFK